MADDRLSLMDDERGARLPADFLKAFLEMAAIHSARAGQYILLDGDLSSDVYVVISGEVEFVLFSESGKKLLLRSLGANRMFGEMAALNGEPRSTSVMALSDVKLARASGGQFCNLLRALPEASFWLNQQLALRVRNVTRKTYNLATQSVTSRIIGDLLRMSEGGKEFDGSIIIEDFPIHNKLADRLGTHREAVSREISKLKKKGLVKKSGKTLVIVSPSGLRDLHDRLIG